MSSLAVLILVLMEDTLGERHRAVRQRIGGVLILVLMEDTLGDKQELAKEIELQVLILVLMEDTLGVLVRELSQQQAWS